jgi:arylsulfatase A-like enzyme
MALLVVACTMPATPPPTPSRTDPPDRPDVVIILTDDQRWDTMREMPGVRQALGVQGTTFRNAFVANPLCCPSRASILTGRYSHSTGVWTNSPRDRGLGAFDDGATLATWLDEAGYRTALIGKYFNGYHSPWYVPPGWDEWRAFLSGRSPYYDFEMSVDGRRSTFGSEPSDYSTDVLARSAERTIHGTPSDEPLFLFLATSAPHQPGTPAPRHERDRVSEAFTPGPNIPELDVSDKPDYIEALSPNPRDPRRLWSDQVAALRAVDDLVRRTVRALRETGRLRETVLIFTSDNGLAIGEHRWGYKLTPYEEVIRVPLVVRYDPLTRGQSTSALAVNVDLAPTVAEIAGISVPGAEGFSLVPVLADANDSVRREVLIEHFQYRAEPRPDPPSYCAVRTLDRLFVRYATGEEELYDLRRDPYELDNLASDPGSRAELEHLRDRAMELCRPQPPGFSWSLEEADT